MTPQSSPAGTAYFRSAVPAGDGCHPWNRKGGLTPRQCRLEINRRSRHREAVA